MRQVQITSSVLKRPDIGLSDRLLIASILCQPADQRPWHLMRNGGKIKRRLENRAYRMISRMDKIEQKVNQKWSDQLVEEYLKLDKELEKLMDEVSCFSFCLEAINEALEIVEPICIGVKF